MCSKPVFSSSKQFNGQGTGARTYWNHGDQALRTHADDGDVVGVFVDDQKEVAARIECRGTRAAACRYWGEQMAGKHGNGVTLLASASETKTREASRRIV